MPTQVKNDEQIKVDLTVGLISGSSSFTFDGNGGSPDYRGYVPTFSEAGGDVLIRGIDYTWDYQTGIFVFKNIATVFITDATYNVHFQEVNQSVVGIHSNLINYSFFVGDITIPNIIPKVRGINPILDRLDTFIAKYEQECLKLAFGYGLFKAFVTEDSPRMDNILFGTEFTYNEKLYVWQGLIRDENISLIASFIYFYFQRSSVTQTTGVAEVKNKAEAGITATPSFKMIDAWNFFSNETRYLLFFLWTMKKDDGTRMYPEFDYTQYCKSLNSTRKINQFGI
jgi:hypothetical protein